ncbi:hypothetical protein AAFF_G00308530 [Aldrovandia affinis]|uniref:Inactive dual specificity phosphatase 27 n=1 Tax=Aldrovandia affinis TaxID=143900 RepID=A0AAD7SNQ5_9TELE|nr:hypothetical protein AAFF_G00308530 [Aldrovandia affinis]
MATRSDQENEVDHVVPDSDTPSVMSSPSSHLRCSSPSRFSVISGTDTESIFMEPMNLSSLLATKQIINEDLGQEDEVEPDPAEQMMVEDLYERVKDMVDETSPYNTPCVLDIQRALLKDRLEAPLNPVDEVWPNIFIAEKTVAHTGAEFYAAMNIQYHGIEVDDFPSADISPHLRTAAEFLDEALLTHRGKVLVDSVMGVSRSAVLVAAYLMIFHHMTIVEALLALRKKRPICPNEGFLKQLRDLNEALLEERDEDERSDTLSQSSVIDTHARQADSILGAQVHSILVEEEDGRSVVSSSVTGSSVGGHVPSLPGEEEGEEEDVARMVKEWQQRNEKYQNEDWWQAQLMSEDEDEEPLVGRKVPLPEDLESVTSADVRAATERPRPTHAESVTTDTSCVDQWKQRLREIEEQAAARYKGRDQEDDSESGGGAGEEDEDTGSLYNFCKRNKDTLTPLERWRVKRIQFGWNKKDAEAEGGQDGGAQDAKTPSLEDVNLTAYQSWKLRQQKKLGNDDKDAIAELSREQDSALAKRRQRREELLERSRRTLEESQSACGWETESALSGSTIPLSAFWQLASGRSPVPDDSASLLSSHSSRSSRSQTRSACGSTPALPTPMIPLQGQGAEVVDLQSIQNWIANVVTETLLQRQGEMLTGGGGLPSSRASSVLSLGTQSGRGLDDDKASMLSGASYSSGLSRRGGESLLSAGGASAYSGYGSGRAKITKTSVPLYSLFQDQVNLRKLDSMDKEMKSEMRDKMATYELQKIAADNKRSTLFKKKKKKEESDEEAEDNSVETTKAASKYSPTPARFPSRDSTRDRLDTPTLGCTRSLGSSAVERDKATSIDRWLNDIRAPSRYPRPDSGERTEPRDPLLTQTTAEPQYGFSSRRRDSDSSFHSEEEEAFSSCSFRGDSADNISEAPYHSRMSPPTTDPLSNGLKEPQNYRMQRSYTSEEEEEEEKVREHAPRRTFSRYQDDHAELRRGGHEEEEQEEEVSSFVSRCRLQSRQAEENLDDDDVIGAWRRQQESKRRTNRGSDS